MKGNSRSREHVVLGIALLIGVVVFLLPKDPSNPQQTAATPVQKRGLTWDIDHDSQLTADERILSKIAAAKVLADDPGCDEIYLGGRASDNKGLRVTCKGADNFSYNVFFDKSAVASPAPLRAPPAYDEALSRKLCEEKIRTSANFPSTVDIHAFTGYGTKVFPNGARNVRQDFSARNAYNLELTYIALCTVFPDGNVDFSVREKGAR